MIIVYPRDDVFLDDPRQSMHNQILHACVGPVCDVGVDVCADLEHPC